MAWKWAAFIVTAGAVLLLASWLFEFWPLSVLVAKRPALAREPLLRAAERRRRARSVTLVVWGIPVVLAGADPVVFMTRAPVAVIFGVFIVQAIFQSVGFSRFAQALKGVAMTATMIVLALVVQVIQRRSDLYAACGDSHCYRGAVDAADP